MPSYPVTVDVNPIRSVIRLIGYALSKLVLQPVLNTFPGPVDNPVLAAVLQVVRRLDDTVDPKPGLGGGNYFSTTFTVMNLTDKTIRLLQVQSGNSTLWFMPKIGTELGPGEQQTFTGGIDSGDLTVAYVYKPVPGGSPSNVFWDVSMGNGGWVLPSWSSCGSDTGGGCANAPEQHFIALTLRSERLPQIDPSASKVQPTINNLCHFYPGTGCSFTLTNLREFYSAPKTLTNDYGNPGNSAITIQVPVTDSIGYASTLDLTKYDAPLLTYAVDVSAQKRTGQTWMTTRTVNELAPLTIAPNAKAHVAIEYPMYTFQGIVTVQVGQQELQMPMTFTAPNLSKPVIFSSVPAAATT